MNDNILMLLGMLVASFVVFLILSAIFMGLWNTCVKKAVREDSVKEIDYPTAMGLTLFFSLFIMGPAAIINSK